MADSTFYRQSKKKKKITPPTSYFYRPSAINCRQINTRSVTFTLSFKAYLPAQLTAVRFVQSCERIILRLNNSTYSSRFVKMNVPKYKL